MTRQTRILSLLSCLFVFFPVHQTYAQDIPAEPVEFIRDMAELGDAEAQWLLGKYYETGEQDLDQDYDRAVKWYTRSAERGYVPAQTSLGFLYKSGVGVLQSYTEALKWFRLAAQQRDMMAQTALGVMYERGMGVKEDYGKALEWYGHATDQGGVVGLMGVASIYFFGKGVPKGEVEGYAWVLLLSYKGNAWGIKCKEEWGRFMTSEQITQAEQRARELQKHLFGL